MIRTLDRRLRACRASSIRNAVQRVSHFEQLETRAMFCEAHAALGLPEPVELRPDLLKLAMAGKVTQVNEPANIVWQNRSSKIAEDDEFEDTDGFFATFGAKASLARNVVDAVIVSYERMIGSFNYPTAGQQYFLDVAMNGNDGSGFGASAGLTSSLSGIPRSGGITMGTGSADEDPDTDNGWFLDPTPFESSEFTGNITNGFALNAQSGSPAAGRGDFYTVVAAEMTHAMGLIGSSLSRWAALTTETTVPDTAEGGGPNNTNGAKGNFWVFRGPSIKHLMTGNNGGPNGQDRNSAIHAAGPGVPVVFAGDTYIGSQDQGNAVYEFSRRYLVNNAFALMFKDAFGYGSVDPSKWQSAYSILNETSRVVTVRGGDATSGSAASDDIINITRSGNTVSVSVDVGQDIAGTGALPGAGNLPAFVTQYDIGQLSSISIASGAGADNITIASDLGIPVTIDAGSGTDTVNFTGTAAADSLTVSSTGASSPGTTVTITSGVENLVINGLAGGDTFNVASMASGRPVTLNGGDGDDIFSTVSGLSFVSLAVNGGNDNDTVAVGLAFASPVTFDGGAGTDAASTEGSDNNDSISLGATSVTGGGNTLNYSALESLTLNARNGVDTITVNGASLTLAVIVNAGAGNDVMNINALNGGNLTYNAGAGTDSITVNVGATWNVNGDLGASAQTVNVTAPGTVRFNATQHLNNLNVSGSGRASVTTNGARLLNTKALAVAANAQVDLMDNDMLVQTASASARSVIEGYVKKGYNFGGFNGVGGVTSSIARDNPNTNTALGLLSGQEFNATNGGSFDGETAAANDTLIKYTWYGDVDFNGQVDTTDYNIVDFGFLTGATGWANGDVDFNGQVDTTDYNLIDFAFLSQVGTL